MTSVRYQGLIGVQAAIQAAGLTIPTGADPAPALPSSQVYVRKLPRDWNLTLPCVVVSYGGRREEEDAATTSVSMWRYPYVVTLLQANMLGLDPDDEEPLWRQELRQVFNRQRPPAVVSAMTISLLTGAGISFADTHWEPDAVTPQELLVRENLVSDSATVWVRTCEPLGTNT